MRPTPPAPRGANRWIISFGCAGLMAVAAAWWLGLLPTPKFLAGTESKVIDADPQEKSTRSNPAVKGTSAAEAASIDIEQWEPGMPLSARPAASNRSELQVEESPAFVDRSASDPDPPASRSTDAFTVHEPYEPSTSPSILRVSGEASAVPDVVPLAQAQPSVDPYSELDAAIESGRYLEAHRDLSKLYWSKPEEREQIVPRLQQTAALIYLSPQPHFMEPYVIQPGDLLQKVAPQYKISWEYLAKLNRIQPEKIRAGQKLKVVKGPFSAFIDLSDYRLTIHAHGYFVKEYAIGIGKDNSTPIGTFAVKDKLRNPVYYGPDGVIAADDPANPLGECWIDLGDSYGIHGTIDPKSIGKAESRGCIRLVADDVAEVYDFLTLGSEVVIRP